jgi:hypothetical protein
MESVSNPVSKRRCVVTAQAPTTLATLRALSDDELVELYDRLAPTTVVGTAFFLDELARRDRGRQARLALVVSLVSLGVAALSLVVSLIR